MSLARICTLHDLSLCRHDVYAIAHHGFEPLLRPILSFLASTYSATVTIAHRIIFTYQKEVECRCACGRYLIILIYNIFMPQKVQKRFINQAVYRLLQKTYYAISSPCSH